MMPAMDSELLAQIDRFQRCIDTRDGALAATVLDDDFALMLMHPTVATMPHRRWLEVLPDYVVHDYRVDQRAVDVDDDVACVLQRVEMRATVLGEDRSGAFVITDVWRRQADGWRVWRRHSTPLAGGVMPGARP